MAIQILNFMASTLLSRPDHNAITMFMKFNQNLWEFCKMEKSCKIYELCWFQSVNKLFSCRQGFEELTKMRLLMEKSNLLFEYRRRKWTILSSSF